MIDPHSAQSGRVFHGRGRRERQRLLRVGFGRAQSQRFPNLASRILGAEELRPQPAEDVIYDRLGVGNVGIAGESARLETTWLNLSTRNFSGMPYCRLKHRSGEAVHQAGDRRALFGQMTSSPDLLLLFQL
jgi:hypothetical protein